MSEAKTIAEVIEITSERFKSIAPKWMQYDAEKGFAIQLLSGNDYLKKAAESNPSSLQQAITNVAAIGLSLNPAEKLAYLIPRNIKTKDASGRDKWETRVYLEPSYMGLIRLATDSGSIEWAQAKCVYSDDEFVDNGPGEKPTHRYNAFKARGEFVGVYCTAKTTKGDYLTTLMDKEAVFSVRARSEAYKRTPPSGPWVTDFDEMAKKTIVRNAFKTWPRTDERRMSILAEAVNISNQNEGFESLISEPVMGHPSVDQKNYFDQLIETNNALGMYCFLESFGNDASSPSASVKVSLMHSFPKGKKGTYQAIVSELKAKGDGLFTDLLMALKDAIQRGDDVAIGETIEGLDHDVIQLLCSKLNNEENNYFDNLNG